MNTLILIAFFDLILTWKWIGFSFCSIAATFTWFLFAGRKIGYFCKMNTLLTWEFVGIFFMVTFQLITKNVQIDMWIKAIVLRLIFLGIAKYDMKNFVYIVEEKRKDI